MIRKQSPEESISHAKLLEILYYDPSAGVFTWKIPGRNFGIGKRAGSKQKTGYTAIGFGGRKYLAGRLAFFYVTGRWPDECIDHINLNKADDRFENLREATMSENQCNTAIRSHNTTGYKGVNLNGGRYRATLKIRGKQICVGWFDSAEEASEAYIAAAKIHYGKFARVA